MIEFKSLILCLIFIIPQNLSHSVYTSLEPALSTFSLCSLMFWTTISICSTTSHCIKLNFGAIGVLYALICVSISGAAWVKIDIEAYCMLQYLAALRKQERESRERRVITQLHYLYYKPKLRMQYLIRHNQAQNKSAHRATSELQRVRHHWRPLCALTALYGYKFILWNLNRYVWTD